MSANSTDRAPDGADVHHVQDVSHRQAAAIAESGWGTGFHLIQPRNLCFWVFLWGMAAGAFQILQTYSPAIGPYGLALGSGLLVFALYTIPWVLLLNYHNRYTSIPRSALVVAFVWSFVAGTYWMGLQANSAVLSLWAKAFGTGFAQDWSAGLTAPITEEIAKATALVLIMGLAPRMVNSAYDGLIIGGFAGLGLQIAEDVLYVANGAAAAHGVDQVGAAVSTLYSRGIAGLTQHVLFSAVFCAGLMWLIGKEKGHRLRGGLLMLAVVVLHSCWDNMIAVGTLLFGRLGPIILPFLLLPVLGGLLLWWTFRLAAPREQAWMRDLLRPEQENGVLTEPELVAIAGGYRARRHFLRTAEHRRSARHVLAAAADLARELAGAGGQETPLVAHARSEVLRLRTNAELHAARHRTGTA